MKIITLYATLMIAGTLHAATYYVSASRPDDSGDGTSWATAKKTIQAALDRTVNGDTVLVTNGVYKTGGRECHESENPALTNRVVITNSITLKSVNGPEVTIIEGSGTNRLGTAQAVRCAYMSKGVLSGFTLRKGVTLESLDGYIDSYHSCGGGVNMYNAAIGTTVTNCIITGCVSTLAGGGVAYGTLRDCIVSSNSIISYAGICKGGGTYNSAAINCRISENSSIPYKSGSYANTAQGWGGGGYGGTFINCVIRNNYIRTIDRSYNSSTTTYALGGGICYGSLTNCLVADNISETYGDAQGGGTYESPAYNCTIAKNVFTAQQNSPMGRKNNIGAAGCHGGKIVNSVIYDNTIDLASAGIVSSNYSGTANLSFSCTIPVAPGPGNFDRDPKFVDADSGNFRLQPTSICIDAGDNAAVATTNDIVGLPRIHGGTVDMGAYENIPIFTVTFDAQGGSTPAPQSITATNSFKYGPLALTAKTGHTFMGWYTLPWETGVLVTSNTTVQSSQAETLYARWSANIYTVSFDAQGGTVTPASKAVTFGGIYGDMPTPSFTGYVFEGWNTGPAANGSAVTPATVVSNASDHMLYAKWSEIKTLLSPVSVPHSWLDRYPSLMRMAGGNYEVGALIDFDLDGRMTWEEYVAGTVPTNGLSSFQALIDVEGGSPLISWTPDLTPERVYAVEGKTNLIDAAWGPTNPATRFFRVKVEMP